MNNSDTSIIKPPSTCFRCHAALGTQVVRALQGTFHPECFTCPDCNTPVAAKFFPFTTDDGHTFPLCERDYFRRLGLVCNHCDEPLLGSYIIALDKKFHTDHFTCSVCSTTFGHDDSYYEQNGQIFCHFHYSTQFAVSCAGCQMAILKQYVEIERSDMIEHWHSECYMIYKYWNVKMANFSSSALTDKQHDPTPNPAELIEKQHETEEKVFRIWSVLSAFEESSAVCISEMLLHVSNGAYVEGICLSERFLIHVEALFSGVDELLAIHQQYRQPEFKYTGEAKMLCQKIINFFSLLSRTQEMDKKKLGITQELLSLVTGLAHFLKNLIRVALTAALRLELQIGTPIAVTRLLAKLMEVAGKERHSRDSQRLFKAKQASDYCHFCKSTIEDHCWKYGNYRWHLKCFHCRQCKRKLHADNQEDAVFSSAALSVLCTQCAGVDGTRFEYVTKLTQFAFLLRIALSRLCGILQVTDNQLSTVDISIKSKPYLPKDVPLTPGVESKSVLSSVLDEKTIHYPTHIADAQSVSSARLDRKISRSFKTAKRSTIMGNAQMNPLTEEPGDTTATATATTTAAAKEPSKPAPARLDSLLRRMDQHKELPPLPKNKNNTRHKATRSVNLDDIPHMAAEAVSHQKPYHPPSVQPTMLSDTAGSGSASSRIYLSELSALQHMIIRHVAVVHIEPYVREFFSFSELLNLIEHKKTSIWGKFFTSLKKPGVNKRNQKGKEEGTFGVLLDALTEKTGVESNLGAGPSPLKIAAFVDDAITAMRQMDMSVEGVFRKNGNIRRLKEVSEQLDKNPHDVNLSSENAVQVAALLKKFLRELPEPLLTYKLHGLFCYAQRLEDSKVRKRVLHLACCMLPRCNRDTMEVLFLFFRWVASFSHVTTDVGSRMDIPNLARVIAPNILTTNNKDPVKDDSFAAIHVVETLLECYEEFCLVPEDLEPFLQDPQFLDNRADLSSKDFLKKVEQLRKHRKPQSPSAGMISSYPSPSNDLRLFDGAVTDGRAHPPTSIYAQQQYLPYPNHHPSSDFYPYQLNQRQPAIDNSGHSSSYHLSMSQDASPMYSSASLKAAAPSQELHSS
ncbi:uncharacterized protein BYT42DRAFT_126373 [Radiomyces spectabilis]|uniref:uncharacterized protein n=1 Tax=Radiomyces spectabilis TaxID=64574 RepID=UPI002220AB9E|nr:uncharacterized protein BYT42DRAFT_126373 [Radiomyces spectabilis]KAI8368322.1 hypothetical protein BYT42DRAFT_126373 [Radiomyces spectabilis]